MGAKRLFMGACSFAGLNVMGAAVEGVGSCEVDLGAKMLAAVAPVVGWGEKTLFATG